MMEVGELARYLLGISIKGYNFKVGLSLSKKTVLFASMKALFKKCFFFILKTLFVLKIFKFLS